LIPSTPFVLAGIMLFPDEPAMVFTISMLGIFLGSTFVYFSASFLDLGTVILNSKPELYAKLEKGMSKYGFLIILAWSFFPLVPTELISYVAASIKYKYYKFISAMMLGEAALVFIYVFIGKSILDWFA